MTERTGLGAMVFWFAATTAASAQGLVERLSFPWSPWPLQVRTAAPPQCSTPPNPPPLPIPPVPPSPPDFLSGLSATPYPLGDLAYDDVLGRFVATDGNLLSVFADPAYPPPTGPLATTYATPSGLGPLTGLAADATAGVLWCTDGAALVPVSLSNPAVALLSPIPLGFTPLSPPITGLDRDPTTGDLVGCDQVGNLYRFDSTGAAVGAVPWRYAPLLGAASDVAVRRNPSSRLHTLVQFRYEGRIVDYDLEPGCPDPVSSGIPTIGQGEGIALIGRARVGDPVHGFQSNYDPLAGVGTTRPPTLDAAPFAVYLNLGTPFYPVFFMLDFAYVDASAGPTPWNLIPLATSQWVLPFLPAWIVATSTDANGCASVAASLNLPPSLAGLTTYAQWAHPFAPAPPSGPWGTVDLSEIVTVELTLP